VNTVVNQYGRYITGRESDIIVDAVNNDKTVVSVDGHIVQIVGVVTDKDGNITIKVDI